MVKKEDCYLSGKLLLAMPQLGDPRFYKSVIFICSHDENGAMGLVINNTLPDVKFRDLLEQLEITSDIQVEIESLSLPVMGGGPVDGARGFLLHSSEFVRKNTVKVNEAYGITGTVDALRDVASGNGPAQKLFILGYAGWEAGQLEAEIRENAWMIVDPDPDLIYHDDPGVKWDMGMAKLGFDPAMLSSEVGNA